MRRLYLIGSIILLWGCTQPQKLDTLIEPLISGKATPIQLDLETTYILVQDYILDPIRLDSVSTDGPFTLILEGTGLQIIGRPEKPLYNLTFWSGGVGESVLLKRTKKTMFSFLYQPKGDEEKVMIKGEFNAWNPNNTVLQKKGSTFTSFAMLSPGKYQYLYVIDGEEMRDPLNPDSISNGMGGWNSLINIAGPDPDKVPTIQTTSYSPGEVILTSNNTIQSIYAYWNNTLISNDLITINGNEIRVSIPPNAQETKRSKIRLWAYNEEGVSNDVLIPLHNGQVVDSNEQLDRSDYEAMVMYFLMVDRFNNGDSTNDKPLNLPEVHPKADYFGGDLAGVTQKIEDGYFEDLGMIGCQRF